MSKIIVPFTRELSLGDAGRDVKAVKRAWRKADPKLIGNNTSLYGPGAVRADRAFERAHHLQVNGVYELADHRRLAPFFDHYGASLMAQQAAILRPPARARLNAAALALYNYRVETERAGHRAVHYSMTTRMTIVRAKLRPPYRSTILEDCSSSCTAYYWQAKLPNPNGWPDYDPARTMFTGTLWRHGVSVHHALPGDLVFYGWDRERGCPKHVAIAVGDDIIEFTHRVITHGHEGGPFLEAIDYRNDLLGIRSYLPR